MNIRSMIINIGVQTITKAQVFSIKSSSGLYYVELTTSVINSLKKMQQYEQLYISTCMHTRKPRNITWH